MEFIFSHTGLRLTRALARQNGVADEGVNFLSLDSPKKSSDHFSWSESYDGKGRVEALFCLVFWLLFG